MKKVLFTVLLVSTFAGYAFYVHQSSQPIPVQNSNPQLSSLKSTGMYRDGLYTGDVVDAFFGNVQVKISIQDGKISDIQFLDYPQDRTRSNEISNFAMPKLTSESIQAQSANVDVVSGATETSFAFKQSLTTALAQALLKN